MTYSEEAPTAWDSIQLKYVNRLIREYKIKNFVETGTFQGRTSLYFSRRGLKVYTVEIKPTYYETSKNNFVGTDIELHLGDSVEFLKEFIARGITDVFYFLDAHWRKPLPLLEELDLILRLNKFIIMVHDIQVKGQEQFSFDFNISGCFYSKELPSGIVKVFPKYKEATTLVNLCGYVILLRNYPVIHDNNFYSL